MEPEETPTGFVVGATINIPNGDSPTTAEVIDVRGKAWLKVQTNDTVKKGWWPIKDLAELNPEAFDALTTKYEEKKAAAEQKRADKKAAREAAAAETPDGETKPKRGRKKATEAETIDETSTSGEGDATE